MSPLKGDIFLSANATIHIMWNENSKIISTIKNVMPAVVSITISKNRADVEREMKEMIPAGKGKKKAAEEPFEIPLDKIDADGMVQIGGGSGFITDASGVILTNKHVISETGAKYTVTTNNGTEYIAEILARDPINDVAILKIKPERKLPYVALGNSDSSELGQSVLAIGNALGIFKNTVSQGIVSGLARSVSAQADPDSPPQELRGLIQTDAAINPGNSGGPLVNLRGEAIGINAAVVYGAQNINFAIPINEAKRDLSDLKKFGRIRRPLLGLRYLSVTSQLQKKLELPFAYGAIVTKQGPFETAVVPESPADKAGLKEGDIVLEWEGKKITPDRNIQDLLENCEVGETAPITVWRDGKTLSLSVTLTERK